MSKHHVQRSVRYDRRAHVISDTPDGRFEGQLVNISKSGALIRMRGHISKGRIIKIHFVGRGRPIPISIQSRVVRATRSMASVYQHFGLRFQFKQPHEQKLIDHLIQHENVDAFTTSEIRSLSPSSSIDALVIAIKLAIYLTAPVALALYALRALGKLP